MNNQDFLGKFDKTPSDDDTDMALVNFIKQNKPIAPSPAPDFEQQLFAEISKYPQRSLNRNFKRWLPLVLTIPVAIATGITFNMTNNRSWQVASQITQADRDAIEQTLISSWNVSDDISATTSATLTDTQLLIELSPHEYE